nr:MAG TPA: hypothetical protein [Caudoviricetes sp.]
MLYTYLILDSLYIVWRGLLFITSIGQSRASQ